MLISRTGGTLRTPAPRLPPGGLSENVGGMSRPRPVHIPRPKPVKVHKPIVKAPVAPRAAQTGQQLNNPAAGAGPGGAQDPFQFIKQLLVSTNPADARTIVDQVYAPIRQQYMDQIAQIDGMAKARADQMSQVYQAFAQYAQGMPAQIQQIYGQSYQSGQQAGNALSGMAGPQGAVGSHLQASADINSQLEQTLGKNWASYAAALPGIYSLYATQNIKSMLGDAQASETKLREDLLGLSSKEASDILSYLQSAQAKDTSLQEWAYGQKQTMDLNASKSQQAYLDYLQKQRQIDFNNAIVQGKLTLAQAKAQADVNYKRSLLQLKQQGLITDQQYKAAQIQLGQQRVGIAQQNANTAAARAAGRGGMTAAAAQKGINDTIAQMNAAVAKAKAPRGGGTQNLYQIGPDGKPVLDANGKPIKIGTKKVPGSSQVNRKGLWQSIYNQYSRQLFSYYRSLYPNLAKKQGAIQRLVEARVTAVVGWGPNG